MNMGDYREGRVRLTDEIKGTLIDLVEREGDFKKKKDHTAEWYRKETALALKLEEAQNPSLRSYEEALKYVRQLFRVKNPLDAPWAIGCCIKYGISPDVVIPFQRQWLSYGRFLTIRRARLYSMLHPILCPLLEKAFPGQSDRNQIRLYQIASFYTRMEQIAEMNGEDYPDTRELDERFIFNQDFSPEAFSLIFANLYYQSGKSSKAKGERPSALKAEQILAGEMTDGEVELLNEYIEFFSTGDFEKANTFYKSNPNIQPFIEKWRVLNLRRDITISKKEGEK